MSKGSVRRPTDEAAYGASYDAIFGRKAEQEWVEHQRAHNLACTETRSDTPRMAHTERSDTDVT